MGLTVKRSTTGIFLFLFLLCLQPNISDAQNLDELVKRVTPDSTSELIAELLPHGSGEVNYGAVLKTLEAKDEKPTATLRTIPGIQNEIFVEGKIKVDLYLIEHYVIFMDHDSRSAFVTERIIPD